MVPSWRLELLQRMQSELVRAECSAAAFFTILHILRTTAAAAPVPGNTTNPQPQTINTKNYEIECQEFLHFIGFSAIAWIATKENRVLLHISQ